LTRLPIDVQPALTEEAPPPTPLPPAEEGKPAADTDHRGDGEEQEPRPADLASPSSRDLTLPPTLLPRMPAWPRKFKSAEEHRACYLRLFRPLPARGEDPHPARGPAGAPLPLSELQRIAMTNSPALRQAQAAVESARGAAYQAGLWPNPTFGFEID